MSDFVETRRGCKQIENNPSVNFVDSSLYTREPELHLNLMCRNVYLYDREISDLRFLFFCSNKKLQKNQSCPICHDAVCYYGSIKEITKTPYAVFFLCKKKKR